jgi:hypothetical protein
LLLVLLTSVALVAAPATVGAAPAASGPTEASTSGPSTLGLVAIGAALAVPDYALTLVQHEGMHALFASAFGARVTYIRLLPDEDRQGHLRLGDTGWTNSLTNGQRVAVLLAPKMADLTGLSVYTVLELADAMPKDKIARLAILVVATGMWVDFAHDVAATGTYSDVVEADALLGARTETQRTPLRVVHGVLALATAIPLVHGYAKLFSGTEVARARRADGHTERGTLEPFVQGETLGIRGTF